MAPAAAPAEARQAPRYESHHARISLEVPNGWEAFDVGDFLVVAARGSQQESFVFAHRGEQAAGTLLSHFGLNTEAERGAREQVELGGVSAQRRTLAVTRGELRLDVLLLELKREDGELALVVIPANSQAGTDILRSVKMMPTDEAYAAECFLSRGCEGAARTSDGEAASAKASEP